MRSKKLTIVIVTFQSAKIIDSCLNKIDVNNYEIVVVDNNSSDNTVKIVQENFPKVNLIRLDQNIGYGRANNIALRKVKTNYALILNPDAFIYKKDIEEVIRIMDMNKNIAICTPRILYAKDTNGTLKNYKQELVNKSKKKLEYVDFVVGCLMFLRIEVFNKIGFFNENIFMFCEDSEISELSIKNGYKNATIKSASGYHLVGKSSELSLKGIYKRNWHIAWSKSYWKSRKKNKFSLIIYLIRISLIKLIKSLFLILNKKEAIINLALFNGHFSYLLGLKAFKKNGESRG